jgi:hypothetical protein
MTNVPYVQYGLVQYGLYPYGRYDVKTDSYKLVNQPRMRIRLRKADGGIGVWVETQKAEQNVPGHFPAIRIRTNSGEWIYTQSVSLPKHASKVRVRTRSDDNVHPWIIYEEAKIEQEDE